MREILACWAGLARMGEREPAREVTRMTIPYAAKLLIQELLSMNVSARLKLVDEFPA